MRYIPQVESFVLDRMLRLGDTHMVMVGTDCVSLGDNVEYIYVFLVSKLTERLTTFAVAAEISPHLRAAKAKGDVPAEQSIVVMGVFPCDDSAMHMNYGFSDDYLDLEKFVAKATEVTIDYLKLEGAVFENRVPPQEQKRIPFLERPAKPQ